MKIKIIRKIFNEHETIGSLYIDDKFECYTLEDAVRVIKIPSETAIPKGLYKVIINMSTRFKRLLPLLIDVPNFRGVRIHSGNTNHDTEGCILVGQTKTLTSVGSSRKAFAALFAKMQKATDITISIE